MTPQFRQLGDSANAGVTAMMLGSHSTRQPMTLVRIYVLCDPTTGEVRYVGKTIKGLDHRLRIHVANALTGTHNHRHAWIKGLLRAGVEPIIRQVDQSNDANWVECERQWIAKYRAEGARLTNATDGGEGSHGHIKSAETLAKMSASLKGKPISQEQRAKLSAAMKGRKLSEEHRQKSVAILAVIAARPRTERQLLAMAANRAKATADGTFKGEGNGRSKLTAKQAAEIRGSTMTLSQIMTKYGIGKSQASRVRRGIQWR